MTENRRPLVDEGVHTFLLPFGRKRCLEQKTLVPQSFRKRSLERSIDGLLGHFDCRCVVAGDRMRGFQGNLQKVAVRYDARNETDSLRLGTPERGSSPT